MSTSSSRFLPFHVPLIEEDDMRAVREVMECKWITTGPKAAQFEQEFARYIGARHAIAVNSGTAALHLALEAAGVREGDEVVLPTLTFAATAEAVVYLKARPVLVDIEPDTFNLDAARARRAITSRTRALVPVHFAGQPCEMDALREMAHARGLKVIEDAAHALPTRYRGQMVGTIGDITCFSFYATKSITTGEGGMVTTDQEAWADRVRIMRLHGISKDAWKRYSAEGSWRYEILDAGFKYNLTDMQAALGLTQLAKCERMWLRRQQLAARYTEALAAVEAYELPVVRGDVQHAWHLYVIRIRPGELSMQRDAVIEELKRRGIGVSVHFIPLHLHPYYRDKWGYRRGDFPVAEDYFERCISLPLYPAMTEDDQTRVIDALTEIARNGRRVAVPVTSALPAAAVTAPAWHGSAAKRWLDIAFAIVGLIALSPLMAVCALAVLVTSPGPILFRQRRVGCDGRLFELLKFRTMRTRSDGPRITAARDPRVTSAGRWLRRSKLDEVPQLINVLRGDMSLIGPRPELAEYVACYTPEQRQVLAFRPGMSSPASLAFVNEESVLALHADPQRYYTETLLPQKLAIDLEYCRAASWVTDMKTALATVLSLLPGGRRRRAESLRPMCIEPAGETDSKAA